MKEGMSARIGAETAFGQQSAREDLARQRQGRLDKITRQFEPVRAALESLDKETGLKFKPTDMLTHMRCDVFMGGWRGYIIVDENSYSLYRSTPSAFSDFWSDRRPGEPLEEYEGTTTDLKTFMGALAYCAGQEFPEKVKEIQSSIDRYIPRKDEGPEMRPGGPA